MAAAFKACIDILGMEIIIEGFSFTFMQMLIFFSVLYVCSRFIFGVFK